MKRSTLQKRMHKLGICAQLCVIVSPFFHSNLGSEMFLPSPSLSVLRNGQPATLVAVPRWQRNLKTSLSRSPSHYKSISSATLETLRALVPGDAFLLSVRRWP